VRHDNADSTSQLLLLLLLPILISGSYVTVKSDVGQLGDQVTLLSPMNTFKEGTELSFYYHMRISEEDTMAALTLFTYSKLHVYEKRLVEIRGDHGTKWKQMSVYLPEGTYQLAFVATHGLQFLSDIALDDISVGLSRCCDLANEAKTKGMFIHTRWFKIKPPSFCCNFIKC